MPVPGDHGAEPVTHTITRYAYAVKESGTPDGFHRA